MKTIRCKMTCDEMKVTKSHGQNQPHMFSYELVPVIGDSPENKSFWEYTPSGVLRIECSSQKDLFIQGKEYYVDISLAEDVKALKEK